MGVITEVELRSDTVDIGCDEGTLLDVDVDWETDINPDVDIGCDEGTLLDADVDWGTDVDTSCDEGTPLDVDVDWGTEVGPFCSDDVLIGTAKDAIATVYDGKVVG